MDDDTTGATGAPRRLARRTRDAWNEARIRLQCQRHVEAVTYRWTCRRLRRRQAAETAREDVLDTVLDVKPGVDPHRVHALQLRPEFERLVEHVADFEPTVVLELGAFQGGTAYVWARALASTEQVVTVDQPVWTEGIHRRRRALFDGFDDETDIDLVFGNSHDAATVDAVERRLAGDVDFLFVDGDHSYEGVAEDFDTYRRLLGGDGLVAFHDTRRHAADEAERRRRLQAVEDLAPRHVAVGRPEWGVSEFWSELEARHDTVEFVTHPEQLGKGIGVVHL